MTASTQEQNRLFLHFCSVRQCHITPGFSALSHLTDEATEAERSMWVSREAWCKVGSPNSAPRHSSRLSLHVGGLTGICWKLLPCSWGAHPLHLWSRSLISKICSQAGLELWPRHGTTLSLKRFPHPKRSQSSILVEPWLLGIEG